MESIPEDAKKEKRGSLYKEEHRKFEATFSMGK
jgi:hypothetical protein